MHGLAERSLDALDTAVAHLDAGEERGGQREMCAAVAGAIETERHLLAEAGTGTGKSLAYLVPAILSGRRVVVATATKALQDQLVHKDVPFLQKALDTDARAAVLKGRSNYLCLARLSEAAEEGTDDQQLRLVREAVVSETIPLLAEWAATADSGERDDLPVDVSPLLWDALTVGARDCPGARACPKGDECFAERAREDARSADLVIVNTHLYCLDLAVGGGLLGEHDAVVIDEAHTLEETASNVFGLSMGPGRFTWLASQLRGLLVRDASEIDSVERLSRTFAGALDGRAGRRVDLSERDLADAVTTAGSLLGDVLGTLRSLEVPHSAEARRQRVLQATDGLARELEVLSTSREGEVSWVEESDGSPVLRLAPVDVGPVLDEHLFAGRTVVTTSATLSVGGDVGPTAWNLGLRDPEAWTGQRVASPFDYRTQGILYCAAHLPDPRDDTFIDRAVEELGGLIEAAGGRTLALFTSYRALHAAADALRDRWDWTVLVQDEAPRSALLEQLRDDEQSCLLATMSFWQGVDVPGDALRLVAIDKLPFARPDEPLVQARRQAAEAAGRSGFETVDLARAARMLAQGAGRLIRTSADRGVVAVLDRRLARARYRRAILDSLPPLRRSVDIGEVRAFLGGTGGQP